MIKATHHLPIAMTYAVWQFPRVSIPGKHSAQSKPAKTRMLAGYEEYEPREYALAACSLPRTQASSQARLTGLGAPSSSGRQATKWWADGEEPIYYVVSPKVCCSLFLVTYYQRHHSECLLQSQLILRTTWLLRKALNLYQASTLEHMSVAYHCMHHRMTTRSQVPDYLPHFHCPVIFVAVYSQDAAATTSCMASCFSVRTPKFPMPLLANLLPIGRHGWRTIA